MAAQRPDPSHQGTTYMDVRGIAFEVNGLHGRSKEGEVNGVWDSILNWVFDPVNGFVTRPQGMHTKTGGERGFSDFHTMDVNGGRRRSFLITQCKAADEEGQDIVWKDGAEQRLKYLKMQHGKRRATRRPYGILAIGRRVRFWQYDGPTQTLMGWRPSAPIPDPNGNREFYYLYREITEVQNALREILNHH